MARDLLESLWCQDALGVMLAGIQVLGTEVQLFLTQLTCNRGGVLDLQGRWQASSQQAASQLIVENKAK